MMTRRGLFGFAAAVPAAAAFAAVPYQPKMVAAKDWLALSGRELVNIINSRFPPLGWDEQHTLTGNVTFDGAKRALEEGEAYVKNIRAKAEDAT